MKKLLSIILSVAMLLTSTASVFAEPINDIGAENQSNPTYITKKIPIPDDLKDTSAWDIIAQYKDTKEPITLSYGFKGYVYATVPIENKDREIEAAIPQSKEFTDYTDDASGDFSSIKELSKTGVILGNENGEAKPYDNVTRAECVAMIMRFLGLENIPKFDKSIRFSDVNKNDWFYPAVTSAYNCKIVEGDSETTFSPNRNVTREEVVTMTARALKYADLNCNASSGDYTYQDFNSVSDWAKDSYTFLKSNVPMEKISGTETTVYVDLKPQDSALRMDVAETLNPLWRMCQTYPLDLATQYGFDKEMPIIDGSTSTYPFTQAVYSKLFYNGENQKTFPQKHSKSHASYERLINGEVDMLFASVYPASDILELAKEKGVELELIPIAYDAMIFFTNAENPAEGLTKEQITDIYVNDKYESWSEIGGPDALLYPYCRNNDSGSHAQMEKHFLNGKDIHPEVQKETSTAMADILTDVIYSKTDDPVGYGLGYSIYYYFRNMDVFYDTNTRLKLLAIDSVAPTDETIADGTYPLANNTYVVLRKDTPKDAPARKMAEFMLTKEGQACVKDAGYGILTEYKDKFIAESLEEYYNKTEPLNKGELKVLLCKPFDYNQHLVLAEKYSGDGHTSSDLFLLDPYFNVNAVTNVLVPLSPCFSLGQVFLGGKTILFGTFDDTKYVPQDDKVVQVKINEIKAELESGEKVTEKVEMDKGYILIFNGESPVKTFDLYNDKQELQSVITDSFVSETEMYFNIN